VDPPRPTLGAPAEELLELAQLLRRALAGREEAPSGDWVEEVAADLRAGRKPGWYYPTVSGGGFAFYSSREAEGFGHVHVLEGPGASDRALRLATALLDGLSPDLSSLDVGFTGLPPEEERDVLQRIAERPGSTIIDRDAMVRALGPADVAPLSGPPAGLEHVAVTEVTLEALADLDLRSFAGTTDELLIGHRVEDYARVLRALMEGNLGRFLPEASTALLASEPLRVVGAILSAEKTARRAVFLDFMVDPADRRRGIGEYLLRWGFRALWALGYSDVHLWVTRSNTTARRLYDRLGFRPTVSATIYRWERPGSEPHAHSSR
jgi:ribosomal protein S18 acetylase RimI-like enzyme